MPSVAPSVIAFISSVFSGRITEPVRKKSRISVVSEMIATSSGRWSMRLCFWSMKPAVLPETSVVAAAGGASERIALTLSCELPESAGPVRAKLA